MNTFWNIVNTFFYLVIGAKSVLDGLLAWLSECKYVIAYNHPKSTAHYNLFTDF